ncbi:BA14K family protein [Acetobacter sp. TBRC 12305]|uniref:BA14K family protein n=1 Tax=Acetobacter garciniae TaxID=2817435 RepID=A0A939HNX2_9PROT|nr:BA14K family protein [Acetobacter garciniae]MBO1324499.1 BA14K family protein [Acetobacter garciniae]MBX0344188.1 BA14K family protein [Acetobacter garciniae]
MPRLYSALVVPCLLAGLGLAGCTNPTPPARIPPQSFAPGLAAEAANPNESTLTNDPSAPLNTPLCGTAAREGMAMAVQNYPQPLAVGSTCTQNACFNTQTGTYIAADGTRRVCR